MRFPPDSNQSIWHRETAFSVQNRKYKFARLAFCLKNAPAICQRTLDDILRKQIAKFDVYIVDIIIFTKDEKTYAQHIPEIFETLQDTNMKVQMNKSQLFKKET